MTCHAAAWKSYTTGCSGALAALYAGAMGLFDSRLRLTRAETKALQRLPNTLALSQSGENGVSRNTRIPAAQIMGQSGCRDELTERQTGIGRQCCAILAPQIMRGHVPALHTARMIRHPSRRAGGARPVQAYL